MGGRLDYSFAFGTKGARRPPSAHADSPFRVLLVADFSGRQGRDATPRIPKPVRADAADVDRALASFDAQIDIATQDGVVALGIERLEHLEPDSLMTRLSTFEEPRTLRRALAAASPTDETLAAVEAWLVRQGAPAVGQEAATSSPQSAMASPSVTSGSAPSASAPDDTMLSRLLGRPVGATPTVASPPKGILDSLLQSTVAPHVTRDVGGRKSALLAQLDEALAVQMRSVLKAPALRALEATWRGAARLIGSLDTDEELEVWLLDAGLADLAHTVRSASGDLERTALHGLLVEGGRAWSVVALDFAFGQSDDDIEILAAMGALCARGGAALLADASPSLFGASSKGDVRDPALWTADLPPLWSALRASPIAPSIGLVFPQLLVRLPYGKRTSPVESFPFEEIPPGASADAGSRVWGSGAFGLAELLGKSFRAEGWPFHPDASLDLDDMPPDMFEEDGERQIAPSAEVPLPERTATAISARGIMPFLVRRDLHAVRLLRTSSIAEPLSALRGPWMGG